LGQEWKNLEDSARNQNKGERRGGGLFKFLKNFFLKKVSMENLKPTHSRTHTPIS
jgi:hypothetical protein